MLHLLNNSGNVLPFEDFCSKFNPNDREQYNKVIKAIPQSVIVMSYSLFQNNVNLNLPSLLVNGHNITNLKLPNFTTLIKESYPFSSNMNSILQFFSEKEAESLRLKFFKFPVAPKGKEVHFMILNEIYPSAEFLRRHSGLVHNNCSFCDELIETTEHLFYEHNFAHAFWDDLHYWLFPKFVSFSNSTKENVLFGFPV